MSKFMLAREGERIVSGVKYYQWRIMTSQWERATICVCAGICLDL